MQEEKSNDLRVINDAKSTCPDSTRAALDALESPVALVIGGRNKGCCFEEVIPQIQSKVSALFIYGQSRLDIKETLDGIVPITLGSSLVEVFDAAWKAGEEGATLLYSPGCESFDQFQGYVERGELFTCLVAGKQGQYGNPVPSKDNSINKKRTNQEGDVNMKNGKLTLALLLGLGMAVGTAVLGTQTSRKAKEMAWTTRVTRYVTHTVKPGDTLEKIAMLYGTTKTKIIKNNGLKNDTVEKGIRLAIPVKGYKQKLII